MAEIRVGEGPGYATVADGSVWVGNHRGNSISRVDPSTNSVVATIQVPGEPTGMTAGFGSIWTFVPGGRSVKRIDIETGAVSATIPVPAPGGSITGFTEGVGSMWLAPEGGRLFRIDPADNTATDVMGLGTDCPGSLTFGDGSLWHVPQCGAPVVLRIDPQAGDVTATIAVPSGTQAVWFGLDRVWAVSGRGDLTEIDPRTDKAARSARIGFSAEQVRTGLGSVWVRVDAQMLASVDPQDLTVEHVYELPPAQIPGGGIAISDDSVWAVNFGAATVSRIQPLN